MNIRLKKEERLKTKEHSIQLKALQKRQQHNSFTMKEDSNKHSIYE
jgi:hypothetical protein